MTVTQPLIALQAQRQRRRTLAIVLVGRILVGIFSVGGWEWVSGRWISDYWISKPSAIVNYLLREAGSGQLARDMSTTFQEMLYGYVIGAFLGLLLGFVLGRAELWARILDPYLMALWGVPRIALAPLMIVWFGVGLASKVVLSATVTFFLVFFNTYTGARSVDPDYVNVIRVMGGRERDVVTKVILPSAVPWVIAGLKIAIPQAFIAAIVGEFIISNRGLGYRINYNSNTFFTAGTLGSVIVVSLLVVLINFILVWLEARAMRWRKQSPIGEG